MYATCLHCHHDLGRNESIEQFPIGGRLAFDSAKGRLWVVCSSCDRWNLSPIEERWEAVESCERLFCGQRLRAQTDNVGLARLADGTDLIRIGSPLRPEFAAWRYGAVFRRRLERRSAMVAGAGAVTGAVLGLSGFSLVSAAAITATPFLVLPIVWATLVGSALRGRVGGTRIIGENGKPLKVNRLNLDHTRIVVEDDGPFQLSVRHSYGHQLLTGERATRALAALLARINRGGAAWATVADAAEMIADAGDPSRTIAIVAREAERRAGDFEEAAAEVMRGGHGRTFIEAFRALQRQQSRRRTVMNGVPPSNPGALHRLPRVHRLALEMALHESSEQQALDAELEGLQRAWREAEEIASIADNLLTPAHVTSKLTQAKSSK